MEHSKDSWEIFIPICPVPKAYRQGHKRPILTDKARTYQQQVQFFVTGHRPKEAMDGFLGFEIVFYMPRTDSQKRKLYPNTKPDLDNLIKGLLDPLESAGVVKNDSRFVDGVAKKRFAGGQDADSVIQPGTFVRFYRVAESLTPTKPATQNHTEEAKAEPQ